MHKVKLDILENLPDIDIIDAGTRSGEVFGVELPVERRKNGHLTNSC